MKESCAKQVENIRKSQVFPDCPIDGASVFVYSLREITRAFDEIGRNKLLLCEPASLQLCESALCEAAFDARQ